MLSLVHSLAAALAFAAPGPAAQEAPLWQSDYEAARALSRVSVKPLFIVFR